MQAWNDDTATNNPNNTLRGVPAPKREKAAVALELKRMGRESIFSCPVDVMCEWKPPIFDDKSKEDEEFLRTTMQGHIGIIRTCMNILQNKCHEVRQV